MRFNVVIASPAFTMVGSLGGDERSYAVNYCIASFGTHNATDERCCMGEEFFAEMGVAFKALEELARVCVLVAESRTVGCRKLVVIEIGESTIEVEKNPAETSVVPVTIEFYIVAHPVGVSRKALNNNVVYILVEVDQFSYLFELCLRVVAVGDKLHKLLECGFCAEDFIVGSVDEIQLLLLVTPVAVNMVVIRTLANV